MKKHLIAAAVAAAVAAPAAFAQSSATIYGIIDAGYVSAKTQVGGAATQNKYQSIQGGNASTGRLGFRGTEDLGGGLKAEFVTEMNLTVTGGSFTNDSATSENRQTFLALSGGFGRVAAGYVVTPIHGVRAGFDPFGGANMPGQLIVAVSNANIAASQTIATNATYDSAGARTLPANSSSATNQDYALRAQAATYTTPTISGFSATVAMVKSDNDSTAASGVNTPTTSNDGYGLVVNYSQGPLRVAVAYHDLENKITASNVAAATNADSDINNLGIGVAYDFGVAQVFFQHGKDEREYQGATAAAADNVENKNNMIGVSAPFGAVTLRASYTDGTYTLGRGGVKRDQKGMLLGASYSLSKRTDAYAMWGRHERNNAANSATNKDSAVAIGLRHSF